MESHEIIHIIREAIWVLLKVAGPILAVAFVAGFVISLFQALTQMQEMTLAFVPKIVFMLIAMAFFLPFMVGTLSEFSHVLFDRIAHLS